MIKQEKTCQEIIYGGWLYEVFGWWQFSSDKEYVPLPRLRHHAAPQEAVLRTIRIEVEKLGPFY